MGSSAAFKSLEPGPIDLTRLTRIASLNAIFRIERRGDEFHVRLSTAGAFIPAQGGASDPAAADAAIAAALQNGGAKNVTRLYRGGDVPEEHVWLKGEGWTLAYR
jgi:protein-L-isoaspartate(D-aspartate) O-methyltransferase